MTAVLLVTGVATLGALGYIAVEMVRRRQADQAAVEAVTSQGVEIRPGTLHPWPPEHTKLIDETLESAIRFWAQLYPLRAARIRDRFKGARLVFGTTRIPQPGTGYLAKGLTEGKVMRIAWLPEFTLVTVLSLVRHEAGHVAIRAAGVRGGEAEHHAIMVEEGYSA